MLNGCPGTRSSETGQLRIADGERVGQRVADQLRAQAIGQGVADDPPGGDSVRQDTQGPLLELPSDRLGPGKSRVLSLTAPGRGGAPWPRRRSCGRHGAYSAYNSSANSARSRTRGVQP
jgi:hypothetical protein